MADKSSIGRIFSLLRQLADRTSAHDIASLAHLFQISEKTIRRDLKELKDQGIQVVETTGSKNHKTYALDRSQLPPLRLTYDEALAVFLGKSTLTAFEGTGIEQAATSAYEKLRLFLGETEAKYVDKISSRIYFSTQLDTPSH
ncbi:MAG: DeoR family transcriptional regulator [Pirellulaceae bacterium]|nr:DeoR family transcriptional regulator [Pirellulaceae bacterium]